MGCENLQTIGLLIVAFEALSIYTGLQAYLVCSIPVPEIRGNKCWIQLYFSFDIRFNWLFQLVAIVNYFFLNYFGLSICGLV